MSRQEEIRNAIDMIFPIPPSEKGRKYEQALMAIGFEDGVKWADSHPKSPWISVNEKLPPVEKYDMSIMVLAVNTEGKINFSKYDYDAEEWITPESDIFTHWMPLPKLPK